MYFNKDTFTVIAGPCAVESTEQCLTIAEGVKKHGAHIFRGGAYKPRSSPFNFQGLELEGLEILQKVRLLMPIVTEVTQVSTVPIVANSTNILQIGTRNMHNIELLKAVGKENKPVMLKRGYAALIEEEWIMAAKYLQLEGTEEIIMCERGIRTFEPYTRNTLDISAVCAIKTLTDYCVIIDPSHATGRPEMIIPLSLAAAAVGADGIMVEVHNDPEKALCDGHQAITIEQFGQLMEKLKPVVNAVGRHL